ncbi:MAG TPA: hypothetical protein VFR87_12875 [Nocardioidaceae bacterium]|nr:hypothetical protein [Nocardioidaceae bacterium]
MRTTTALPRSADLAVWFTSWAAGEVSLDDARDAIVGGDAAHDVLGMPGEAEPVPLILAVGRLRAAGATGAGLALPVPGDPLGLAGPPAFNADALEAEEAVVLQGVDFGLVPHVVGAGVTWRLHEAESRRQVPDLFEADTALRHALVDAANTLARLDVARWRPEVADELMALRRVSDLTFPPHWEARAVRLASLGARCRAIVDLALDDDGGAVSAAEADARRAALTPLDHAARRALVAACSPHPGR